MIVDDQQRLLDAVLRRDLASFTRKTFHTVDPGSEFLSNWHVDLIADYLMACTLGEMKRLIINIPPRFMKTISVSVAWPAWILGRDPTQRIMAASYSKDLSVRASQDCRLVMDSPWYQRIFPNVKIADDQDTKSKFMTTERGFRFSTSVGGMATGEGGNYLIVDDPLSANQGFSDKYRMRATTWFDQVFSNRLNDKKNGVIVVVMQRLHEQDLSGHLLKKGGWEHLKIPFEQPAKTYVFPWSKRQKTVSEGELLHAARMGPEEMAKEKIALTEYGWAGQYQQEPAPLGGGIFKHAWFVDYEHLPQTYQVIQSWDTANKAEEINDPSCCTTWALASNKYYLLDVFVGRMGYPELKAKVITHAAQWNVDLMLIEDKSSGQSLIQELSKEAHFAIKGIEPHGDKITRASIVSNVVAEGRVFIPAKKTPWLYSYLGEMMTFPNSAHKDQVDSTTQFLNWASKMQSQQPEYKVRAL